MLMGKLLDMAVSLTRAKPPHGTGQPFSQSVAWAFGTRGAVWTQSVTRAWLQGIITGYRQSVYREEQRTEKHDIYSIFPQHLREGP